MDIKVNTVKSYSIELSGQELRYLQDLLGATGVTNTNERGNILEVSNSSLIYDVSLLDIFMDNLYEIIESVLEKHE